MRKITRRHPLNIQRHCCRQQTWQPDLNSDWFSGGFRCGFATICPNQLQRPTVHAPLESSVIPPDARATLSLVVAKEIPSWLRFILQKKSWHTLCVWPWPLFSEVVRDHIPRMASIARGEEGSEASDDTRLTWGEEDLPPFTKAHSSRNWQTNMIFLGVRRIQASELDVWLRERRFLALKLKRLNIKNMQAQNISLLFTKINLQVSTWKIALWWLAPSPLPLPPR